jgi:hypothetical protein
MTTRKQIEKKIKSVYTPSGLPHIQRALILISLLSESMTILEEEVGKGETPRGQIVKTIEELSKLQKKIENTKIHMGELY